MKLEPYEFQNIYVITTYRCNWNCGFCLFKFNKEEEAATSEIVDKLEYAIVSSKKRVYIKITGGEPFLKKSLLKAIFDLAAKYKEKVYKIGIGTNGSLILPEFFNDVVNKTHIFLSRHEIYDGLPTPKDLSINILNNPLIKFRINCNMVKGGVDSIGSIRQYINVKFSSLGITDYCFRELNKVAIDKNNIYPTQIYDYILYYKQNHIDLTEIEKQAKIDLQLEKIKYNGNYYDKNYLYKFHYGAGIKLNIKFRSIDERRLIDYNTKVNPDEVDEFVLHPDGTLTGCWDKDLKLIFKGGDINAKQTVHS